MTTAMSPSYLSAFPGYYLTGDGGYLDEDGYLFVMGRTDDVINVAGHRMSTVIDRGGAGRRHPAVAECAVIGVARRDQGPGAPRFRRAQGRCDGRAAWRPNCIESVRENIGAVACFRLVDVVPALPKTRSGKILRQDPCVASPTGATSRCRRPLRYPAVLDALKTHSLGLTLRAGRKSASNPRPVRRVNG